MPSPVAARRLKRSYVRKHTNNAPGIRPPTSPPQLSDLAFNIHGWAIEEGMAWRSTHEVINAYKATMIKGGFEAKIEELHQENQGMVYRNDLRYTPRELDPDLANTDPSVAQYLVVGYTLQEEDPIFIANKTFARYSENELVGETRPQASNLVRWNNVRTPILVVTPVKENTGTSVRLFALIMPRSGLCQPVLITHERIFYRWEFRASAGARAPQRNKNWNQVIVDKARDLTPPERLLVNGEDHDPDYALTFTPQPAKRRRSSGLTIKQEPDDSIYGELIDDLQESTGVFELHLSLDALLEPLSDRSNVVSLLKAPNVMSRLKIVLNGESRGILNAIRASRSSRIQQEVQASFVRVSRASKMPSAQYTSLLHFAFPGTTFSMNEAHTAMSEIKALWPKLNAVVNVNALLRIKSVMSEVGLAVSFEAMEDFLGNALSLVKFHPDLTDGELQGRLQEAVQISAVLSQSSMFWGSVDKNIGVDAIWLVTLLKEILMIHDWQSRGTERMYQGTIPGSFAGMEIEHYITISDLEHATEVLPNSVKQILDIGRTRDCNVEDVLLWLERLRLRIRQV